MGRWMQHPDDGGVTREALEPQDRTRAQAVPSPARSTGAVDGVVIACGTEANHTCFVA
jgi:hypothetical protein